MHANFSNLSKLVSNVVLFLVAVLIFSTTKLTKYLSFDIKFKFYCISDFSEHSYIHVGEKMELELRTLVGNKRKPLHSVQNR